MTSSAPESKRSSRKVVVFDTNVLLADPNSLLSFPHAEVVIPETVLGELDKLKTARVDPDLRFRGREVSRLLFELSEEGSLIDGVDLSDGGRLRVAPFEQDASLPDGLSQRNADDRILGTAYHVCHTADGECEVTLITNDLNMLLKAQTLGVRVERYGEGVEGGFARRFIIRPFQRYKIPIMILAIALAVFAAVIALALFLRPTSTSSGSIPAEFRQLLTTQQQGALENLLALEKNPDDEEAQLAMGNFYFDAVGRAQSSGDRVSQIQLSKKGIRYYEDYLATQPTDNEARADMATLLFYAGETDRAIREVGKVLDSNPDHVSANYNLGIIYWQGRRDLPAARDQIKKVIELVKDDSQQHGVLESARAILKQIEAEISGETTSTSTTQGVSQ